MSETQHDPEAARAILTEAGATGIRIEEYAAGEMLVACDLGAGVTSAKESAFDSAQEVAAHIVASATQQVNQVFPVEPSENIDADLWAPEDDAPDLGAELYEDEIAESHALETGEATVTAAGEGVESEPSPVQAYPGIAVLEDELGRRRNQVRTWIRDVEKARKRAHSDTSRRTFLAQAYADYQNIVIPNRRPPTEIEQGYADDYLNMLRADEEIERWSTALDDAAEHADMDRLAAIAADLGYAPGS